MCNFSGKRALSCVLAAAAWSSLISLHAHAAITSWNTNAGGDFSTAANWDNGVPDSDDVAVFNRGFVAYEVNFPGGFIFDPPLNYFVDYLRVLTNEVSFVHNFVPLRSNPSLFVLNPDVSIVVAEYAGDVAILNMTLNSLSGANASIGRAGGATGTLNVSGTFSLSGALHVGEFGTGTMNVTNGGTVASANGFIGAHAGSNGQVTVSGANSNWTNGNSLSVARGSLEVNDGGVVSVMGVLQIGNSGRLAGNGLIQGDVDNRGQVTPGTSVGTLSIDGNYAQSGILHIELAAADSFDKLDIDGNITLNGRLNVSLLDEYSPEVGAMFDILDWTGVQSGTFANIDVPLLSPGLAWDKSQLYTSGILSVETGYFQPGDFFTYTQIPDQWGNPSHAAGMLLNDQFNLVYASTGGVLEVGIPGSGGFSMFFTSAGGVQAYLPAIGNIGPLNADLVDPTATSSGAYGGQVTALKLNVDFSDAGHILSGLGIPFGDLVIHDYAPLPQVNGLTVRQLLADANFLIGGGTLSYDILSAHLFIEQVNASFSGENPTQFSQDHLRIPGDCDNDSGIDLDDYTPFPDCLGGPGVPYDPAECECIDLNGDGAVDLSDYADFQSRFTGP